MRQRSRHWASWGAPSLGKERGRRGLDSCGLYGGGAGLNGRAAGRFQNHPSAARLGVREAVHLWNRPTNPIHSTTQASLLFGRPRTVGSLELYGGVVHVTALQNPDLKIGLTAEVYPERGVLCANAAGCKKIFRNSSHRASQIRLLD